MTSQQVLATRETLPFSAAVKAGLEAKAHAVCMTQSSCDHCPMTTYCPLNGMLA